MPTQKRTPFVTAILLLAALFPLKSSAQEYVLLGWNDLGMHCSNKDFSKVVVLPPYNNVSAQLILRSAGAAPQLVTSGYTIEYSIPNNTYSVGKTDFWTYAQQLFGLPNPLPPNIGLTGKGLTGVLDASGNAFAVHGVPITPFADSDHVNEAPFQLIHLVAKRDADGTVLATTDAVIPVSNEVGCVQSGCHASETSILNSHPGVSGFNRSGPVLCASCHASNALGTTGRPEAMSFSYRMHEKHTEVAGPANSISTCYKCHPGPKTQCLRDIMGKNPTNPLVCQDCHGTMENVAQSISNGRRPWFDEPQCGTCHGSAFAEEPGKLFRQSKGHGGLYCSACHGSPHAIQPTVEANDNIQNIRLQGYAGTLGKCSVCHATTPIGPGPHGIVDTTAIVATAPILSSPPDNVAGISKSPTLSWGAPPRATSYGLQLSTDSFFTGLIVDDSTLGQPWYFASPLEGNRTYYWRVRAINGAGSSPWSAAWSFTTTDGTVVAFSVGRAWNIVSLPVRVDNAAVASVFPSATTQAYSFSSADGYTLSGTLAPGAGYWLRFPNGEPMSFTGLPIMQDTVSVSAGWNLIGSVADTISVQSLATVPEGILTSALFGYNGGYYLSPSIVPGHGYWVATNASGKIILSASASRKIASALPSQPDKSWDRFSVRDALGREQVLYLADGLSSPDRYALPPPPPAGALDVRFASDRFVEEYGSGGNTSFDVRISGAAFPLTIAWHLRQGSPIRAVESSGENISISGDGSALLSLAVSMLRLIADPAAAVPTGYALDQNYPNPFNPATTIRYALPFRSAVKISVYGVSGERVAELVNAPQDAGYHQVEWTPQLASGIYFCRFEAVSAENLAATHVQTMKMLLLR